MGERRSKKIEYKIEDNGCFICTSHTLNKYGYAVMKKNNKVTGIHRHIYEECFGFIQKGMVVRHKCDNPSCINPEHLELGTQNDNMQDMAKRGRTRAKLTKKEVLEIREKYKNKKNSKEIIKEYNIGRTTFFNIVARRSWKYI